MKWPIRLIFGYRCSKYDITIKKEHNIFNYFKKKKSIFSKSVILAVNGDVQKLCKHNHTIHLTCFFKFLTCWYLLLNHRGYTNWSNVYFPLLESKIYLSRPLNSVSVNTYDNHHQGRGQLLKKTTWIGNIRRNFQWNECI